MLTNKATSIYIHIPFCAKICYYCDFTKMVPQRVDDYIDALILELQQRVDLTLTYKTIYIGGGTPSVLTLEQFNKLFEFLNKIKLAPDYEFTVEGNVESFSKEKLKFLKINRVNRLSVGMQTLNNRLLKIINREHTKEMFEEFLVTAQSCNFNQINVDLMFALPSQTLAELKEDLQQLITLKLNHVSIYSLILEEKSVFYQNKEHYEFVDEELEFLMYEEVLNFLKENNFKHYEISNFCKDEHYSQHNLVYWDAQNYVGCGLGASGYINNCRYDNIKSITKYIEMADNVDNLVASKEKLTLQDQKSEFLLLGLRKITGVSKKMYQKRFNSNLEIDFNEELAYLSKQGLIENQCDIIRLSSKGLYVANDVFEKFI